MAGSLAARITHALRLMVAHSMQAANHRARAQTSEWASARTYPTVGRKNRPVYHRSCPPSFNSSSFLLHNNFTSHQIATSICNSINHQRVILQQSSESFAALINQFNSNTKLNSSSHLTSSLLTFIPSHIRLSSRLVIKDSTT